MIRHPPRSTLSSSSAASDVYKRQVWNGMFNSIFIATCSAVLCTYFSTMTAYAIHAYNFKAKKFMFTFIPVSYTHLRAHETDSYLVCRLLLEKKKQTEITYAVFFLKKKKIRARGSHL